MLTAGSTGLINVMIAPADYTSQNSKFQRAAYLWRALVIRRYN